MPRSNFVLLQRIIAAMALMFFSVVNAIAQDLKVGYVNTERVLKEAPQAEVARKKLKNEFSPRDEKIVTLQDELKRLTEKQERDDQVMSNAVRKRLERDIISLKRDIKRAREEFTEDFNLRRNEELVKLQKLISMTIQMVAEQESFDLILSDSVLYSSKRVDITQKVLDKLRYAPADGSRNTPRNN